MKLQNIKTVQFALPHMITVLCWIVSSNPRSIATGTCYSVAVRKRCLQKGFNLCYINNIQLYNPFPKHVIWSVYLVNYNQDGYWFHHFVGRFDVRCKDLILVIRVYFDSNMISDNIHNTV